MPAEIDQSVIEVLALDIGVAQIVQSVIEGAVGLGINCGSPPPGTVGLAYSHAFPAGSGDPPYTFAITLGALPPGLGLNAATGVTSGTPTAIGLYTFTVQVTDTLFSVASVVCSILITIPIKISFRGVKRVKDCAAEPKLSEVPALPSVKRAM